MNLLREGKSHVLLEEKNTLLGQSYRKFSQCVPTVV